MEPTRQAISLFDRRLPYLSIRFIAPVLPLPPGIQEFNVMFTPFLTLPASRHEHPMRTRLFAMGMLGIAALTLLPSTLAAQTVPHPRVAKTAIRSAMVSSAKTSAKQAAKPAAPVKVITLTPRELLASPAVYKQKTVQMQGVVAGFSALGLDYPPVKFDAKDYVTLLLYRGDVPEGFQIPLSELKLFVKRDVLKDVKRLGQGDSVSIQGTVVSDALGDAWVNVSRLIVVKSVQKDGVTGEAAADSIGE
jgi:hypothetical protein